MIFRNVGKYPELEMDAILALRKRILECEQQLADLKEELAAAEKLNKKTDGKHDSRPLALEQYRRYGRQMILEGFGLPCVSICQGPSV